jgi:hypothetical protein
MEQSQLFGSLQKQKKYCCKNFTPTKFAPKWCKENGPNWVDQRQLQNGSPKLSWSCAKVSR